MSLATQAHGTGAQATREPSLDTPRPAPISAPAPTIDPVFSVKLPTYATASPLRDLTAEEFALIANDNAGCMEGIESQPLSVREHNRENCRQLLALNPADFVARDLAVPQGYTSGTILLPRAGGKACRDGGCFWYFISDDGSLSSSYGWETFLLGELLEPYEEDCEP